MEMRMEMKASLCVGEYCETAYNIEGLEIRVYCMEELCYCLKENAFLLDMSIMNDKLVDWIGEECRVRELAKQLYPMVHKQGSLSAFVLTILQYVGIYGEEELQAVAQVLKQGSGLSNLEKRKSQIDYMVEKRKYAAAIRGYDMLLETWSDLEREGRELPAGKVRAAILHNKGVALTGLMLYDKAAEYFREAWQADPDRSHLDAYLAAKRMELSEDAYVAFAARNPEFYTESLELEKSMEQFGREWEQQPEFRQLKLRREWRANDRQKYDVENERLITALKNSYRTSVSI